MRPADLQRYKRLLLEKQRELSFFQAEANGLVPAAGGSEGDIVDQANAGAEAELQIRLHQTDRRLLQAVEDALIRINHRGYGVCESCRAPIAKARLEAVP